VHDANSTSSPTSVESSASRNFWILLIVATLYVCYFSNLGVIGFVGPDEPRYAWIARAMVESGDWVTPRLYGQPWFEKPVLYYWEAALSFKVFGGSEAAARMPSALSALIGTLALAWLAWRIYGHDTARWFLLFLPSTVGMIGFSHSAATDMPFAGMIAVAMVCGAVCMRLVQDDKTPILPRTPWLGLICFGFFLGLAVLAKGPAAIILCGGAILFWALFTKRWRDAFRLLHPVAILAFCVTALPWYVICARRNPNFFRVFIIEHNFKRYLTPEFQHIQPFWYYVPVLLVAFLPWIGVFLWSGVVGIREIFRRRTVSDVTLLLICSAVFCVLFFSTSHSKLPGYILPAFPAVGLLLARSVVSLRIGRERSFRYVHCAVAGIFLLLFAAAEIFSRGQSSSAALLVSFSGVSLLLFAVANLILGLVTAADGQERSGHVAAWAVAPILLAMLFTGVSAKYLLGSLLNDPSGRTIALELQKRQIPPTQLFVANLNRSLLYGLRFYLHGEVRNWDQQSGTGGYLLLGSKNCERIAGPGFYCEPQPFDLNSTGRFLYLVIPMAGVGAR
jgi:4-amino-4-deoxy-L-arabinose transferase-like glycosyltransferase